MASDQTTRLFASKNPDEVGYGIRDPRVALPEPLFSQLSSDVLDDVNSWCEALRMAPGSLYRVLPSDAARLILTAVVNDALALIRHIDDWDGRSAAHCARALFEHLINALDVDSSPTNTPQRYVDHQAVTREQVSRRRWYLSLLSKDAQRKEAARLDKLARGANRAVERAIAQYGPGFRRSWADQSLKARADAHGRGGDYDGYRILSAVIHGTSGAMAGIVRDSSAGPMHRIGSDMDLAATAYVEGLRSAHQYFAHLAAMTDRPEAAGMRDRTEALLEHTEAVRRKLARQDRELWPATPDPPPVALLAIYQGGRERWWVFYPLTETIVRADEPDSSDGAGLEVEAARAEARRRNWDGGAGRPITTFVPDVILQPRLGSAHVPAAAIMVPEHLFDR